MRVTFFVASLADVSTRFRVLQYRPLLQRQGISVDVCDLHRPLVRRWRALMSAGAADAVVVHRAFLSPLELALLRRAGHRWVFDFDDAIMLRDSLAAPRFASWQRRVRFARMVRAADHVTAGNVYLGEWARRYSERVTVIPTAVNPDDYQSADFRGSPTLGWIGTRVNLMYLNRIAPALRRVAAARPDMRLTIVSDGRIDIAGVRVVAKQWSASTEAADLADFHVGLMPLADDPWTRGKCGVKALQYMAAGVPVVCSPIGANATIVSDGVNGYHARDEDEWVERLIRLIDDPSRCREMGRTGRALVERSYSIEVQGERLTALLRAVEQSSRGRT